jgi:hypothetical protein
MTHYPLRRCAAVAVTVLSAVLVLQIGPEAAASSAAPAAQASPQVPKVGSCHKYTSRQIGDISPPGVDVACSEKHTATTVFVKRLSGRVDWGDPSLYHRKVAVPCLKAIRQVLGGSSLTYFKTAYKPIYFYPTEAQRERGAKWVRCDMVLYSVRSIRPLPEDLHLGAGPVPDRIARCLDRDLLLTPCSRPHQGRAEVFLKLTGATPPGEAEARRIAARRCVDKLSTSKYRIRPSLPEEWRAGMKGLICYAKTTR